MLFTLVLTYKKKCDKYTVTYLVGSLDFPSFLFLFFCGLLSPGSDSSDDA